MTETTSKPRRYTAHCKGCGVYTSAIDPDGMRGASAFEAGWAGAPDQRPAVFFDTMGNHALACRGCGAARRAKVVAGRYNPKHVCNAKCLASRGFVCDCACGGKNHGASYEAAA